MGKKNKGKLAALTDFLDRLDAEDVHYTLSSVTEGSVLVAAWVGDERWEAEFGADGDVQVEIFSSDGETHDGSKLDELFRRHAAVEA